MFLWHSGRENDEESYPQIINEAKHTSEKIEKANNIYAEQMNEIKVTLSPMPDHKTQKYGPAIQARQVLQQGNDLCLSKT